MNAISPEQRDAISGMLRQGVPIRAIAADVGVSTTTVQKIKKTLTPVALDDAEAAGAEPQDSSRFVIPGKAAEADALAGELGELATAVEWKRAAIVYARVRVGDHGGDRSKINSDLAADKMTPAEYALLGIHGLRSATTIRAYWRAWDDAITEGLAEPVALGDEVTQPDAQWADYYMPTAPGSGFLPPLSEPVIARSSVDDGEDLGLGECPPRASSMPSNQPPQPQPPEPTAPAREPITELDDELIDEDEDVEEDDTDGELVMRNWELILESTMGNLDARIHVTFLGPEFDRDDPVDISLPGADRMARLPSQIEPKIARDLAYGLRQTIPRIQGLMDRLDMRATETMTGNPPAEEKEIE
jgi:hypothetical protein